MRDACEGLGMIAVAVFLGAALLAGEAPAAARAAVAGASAAVALLCWIGWRRSSRGA